MRKIAGMILAILFIAYAAQGQEWTAGIKGGPQLSFVEEDSSFLAGTNLLAWNIGIFYRRKISPAISIQPEALLSIRGAMYHNILSREQEPAYFNYLDFPFLANAHLADDIIELFAGPYFAFLLSHTPLDESHRWTEQDINFKHYDFGGCLGIRVWMKSTSIEIRYTRGMVKVLPFLSIGSNGHYNETVAFQMGFRLPPGASSE